MRIVLLAAAVVACSVPASAQEVPGCHPAPSNERVEISTSQGQVKGLLLCISEDEMVIARDGRLDHIPLGSIGRVVTPADPVWDGALIGASIPAIIWAVFCRDCDAGVMGRQVLAYSLIGLTTDALQTNRRTIYTGGGPSASLSWRVRF
jgi:hypothetical protein